MQCLWRPLALAWLAAAGLVGACRAEAPLPYPAAVAERFAPPAQLYDTPGLRPGREAFTRNDELDAALREIAGDGAAELFSLGASDGGTPLRGLRFSRGAGRPGVLLVGQQHGDEPAGAEALLVVARQLADAAQPLAAVLDAVDVWLLPRLNPDGAQARQRRNAAGLDINRDHLLLQTAEARALARLSVQLRPVLWVDLHEYSALAQHMPQFGGLKRHDMLLQQATTPNLPPALAAAGQAWLLDPLRQALEAQGLRSDWYHTNPERRARGRLAMGGLGPNLARNAGGLRHAVSVLLESRGLGLGRLHLQRRVHSHVVALHSLLRSAAARAGDLQALQAEADAAVAASACRGEIVIEAEHTEAPRELLLLDPLTGADKPVQVTWASAMPWRAKRSRARPCGYWLGAAEAAAVERLRALGRQLRPLAEDQALQAERYRLAALAPGADGEDIAAPLQAKVALVPQTLQAPAGSWYLPLDQPLANLAVAALEPDAPGSYFAHRLIGRGGDLGGLARVMAPPR